jgi:hypothetical protein
MTSHYSAKSLKISISEKLRLKKLRACVRVRVRAWQRNVMRGFHPTNQIRFLDFRLHLIGLRDWGSVRSSAASSDCSVRGVGSVHL